jgi:GNAT superfamily N-acetyltransferase
MPRVLGRSFIHVNDVSVIVEYEEDILTVAEPPELESANEIGRLIAGLVEDGSTIQISPGASTQAILLGLSSKKDLGIHTGYFTDGIMHLVSKGVVTNRRKGHKEGRMVATAALGSKNLYDFLNDNPVVDFEPTDFVYDPSVIARHHKMVSMIVAEAVDLTGQVAADALPYNHFSGITGIVDFVRGAAMAPGGKSILMLPSTSHQGTKSRILPLLSDTIVVVPRGDVHYVVSEYGVVNLFGKSLQERAMAMISIAHPAFRDQLFQKARDMGLLSPKRTLAESIHGVYPRKLEEIISRDGQTITIRPAKPDDMRRIQEHFYSLDKEDVVARFFHEKNRFGRLEVEGVSQVDYVKDLTLLALVGEFGFDKVVAVAEYLLEPTTNLAEVAFSVTRAFQGKGLGKILIRKLAEAARENGIGGLMAYTAPTNTGMIRIFNSLPYKVRNSFEEDVLKLTCRFE